MQTAIEAPIEESEELPALAMKLPKVVVIVSHRNSARTIGKCISRLIHQDYPRELVQIVVVDAGSTDGSADIVRAFHAPNVNQYVVEGSSEAEGQIFGVKNSDSDIVMFTNSDIYVPETWITEHVDRLLSGYDLIGGKVFWGGDKYSFAWNMPTPKHPQFIQRQGMGLGFSNCSVRREVITETGGIRALRSQQDTDFAFRVVRHGRKMMLDPQIEVYHDHPLRSLSACFKRSYVYAMNHVIVMRITYGRIVIGSGHPAMVSIGSLIKEWLTVNGVHAYFQHYGRATDADKQGSLLEFLFIRLFSAKLPQMLGVFVGAVKRRVTIDSIANSHIKRDSQARKH